MVDQTETNPTFTLVPFVAEPSCLALAMNRYTGQRMMLPVSRLKPMILSCVRVLHENNQLRAAENDATCGTSAYV